jgi:monofunctional biosynthetic peptidoglycan transglycosylase
MPPYVIFSFAMAEACAGWHVIDDVVMGGASHSIARCTERGTLLFSGTVSLANGGGFASIRSAPGQYDLRSRAGVALRVRGDGKTYKLNLKTDTRFDGVQYQVAFKTATGAWEEIRLPFSAFEPRFRGRPVPDAPALDPAGVTTFGLLIADKQAGAFRLELEHIEAFE